VPKPIEQQMSELRKLDVSAQGAHDELRKVLRGERGLLIAIAAKLVEEHRLEALAGDCAAAFGKLVDDGVKRDPGCRGKLAIAKALHALDAWDERVFVTGLRIVQREGFDPVDTAAGLRGLCGLAHVHMHRGNALDVLAELLADDERNARAAAAQGLGDSGRPEAGALLRYKLLLDNEDDPDVLATCFDALFALARESAADFAMRLLGEASGAVAEAAALALGSARVSEAVDALAAWCEDCRPEQRQRVGYVALALLRSDAANAVLLAAVRERGKADALAAARALSTFKEDAAVTAALREAIADLAVSLRSEITAILDR
jgi:hypothetical protein